MTDVSTMVDIGKQLNINFKEDEIKKFLVYKELLKEWNQRINITSIKNDREIDIKHFLDSLTLLNTGLFDTKVKVIDVGTGGGFPGVPLKIIKEQLDMILLDSLNKRIIFLKEIIDKLGLGGIEAIHGRAEEFGRNELYREKFDIVVSRAVAPLNILSEYCLPFVKKSGYFIAMKGSNIDEELNNSLNAIKILGGRIKEKRFVVLPEIDICHSLIIIEKIKDTSTKYPRPAGKPKKNPL